MSMFTNPAWVSAAKSQRSRSVHATLTLPCLGDTYEVAHNGDNQDRLELALCEARCRMFDDLHGGSDIDNVTRKPLGARADLLNIWGDLIVRTDGTGLSMDILL